MVLRDSQEDYLEAIYVLGKTHRIVRNVDLARKLKRSKPTVTTMLRRLKEEGYLIIEELGHVCLTPRGKRIAKALFQRHQYYTALLICAGVDPLLADEEGCALEHVLSDDSHEKLKAFLASLGVEPEGKTEME